VTKVKFAMVQVNQNIKTHLLVKKKRRIDIAETFLTWHVKGIFVQ
jgi:hypothetical protein